MADFDEEQVLWSCEKENEDSSPTQRMVKRVSNSTKVVSQQQSSAPVWEGNLKVEISAK
ncbi:hypothetical protein GOBAR_DD19331 [Gossypium barbadense]|nr:hypothetical protein GOBAR_DD19331 [Gossypium barbadense]